MHDEMHYLVGIVGEVHYLVGRLGEAYSSLIIEVGAATRSLKKEKLFSNVMEG